MICLSANKQGADILLDYLGGTLDPAGRADLERHVEECAECRGLLAVSNRLEEWPAPPVSADFDARLYARIAREDAVKPGWLNAWKRYLWRPALPVGAAAFGVLALALFINGPDADDIPNDSPKQAVVQNNADIEQVEQVFEDLELLTPLNAATPGRPTRDNPRDKM